MKLHRIEAVVLRHLYHFPRNWDRLMDAIYWPLMDLVIWGLTTVWLQNSGKLDSNLLLVMLTGIVFWQIVWRSNYEVSVNLLEESWCKNILNLFSTPLTVSEWLAGIIVLGVIKVIFAIVVCFVAAKMLYHLNILNMGTALIPFLVSLMLFGWTMGLVGASLILRFGRQVQTFAWTLGFVFAPLSAVYYPASALPGWLRPAAWSLPTTYVFEGMRSVLASGELPGSLLAWSFGLNAIYLAGALWLFSRMFDYRRANGLGAID